LCGREIGWIGQTRDDHAVPLMLALHNLWPHTLLGCSALGLLAITQPRRFPMRCFSPLARFGCSFCGHDRMALARQPCRPVRHRPLPEGNSKSRGACWC